MLTENMFEKDAGRRIAPRQPLTCNHPIDAQMFTGVCQAIRMNNGSVI